MVVKFGGFFGHYYNMSLLHDALYFLFFLFFFSNLFIYLKERDWFSVCWFTAQWLQQPGLDQVEVKSQELNPDPPPT